MLVGGALEDGGLDPRVRDALGDVPDEEGDHRVGVGLEEHPSVVEEERDVAVRVQARRRDDVQLGLLGHPLHPREVAPEPDHRGVDDRLDPPPVQLVQLLDAVGDAFLDVPVGLAIVLEDLRVQDEHVLVHEGGAEVGGVHRTPTVLMLVTGAVSPTDPWAARGVAQR